MQQGNPNVCMPGDPGYIAPGTPEHSKVVGCSMVGDILGVGYKSPMDRWMQLTGRGAEQEHKRIFDRGHDMEPIILKHMEQDHGRVVEGAQVQFTDPDRPWLICHADGIIPTYTPLKDSAPGGFCGAGIFEAKAPGSRVTADFRNHGLPGNYVSQGQLGMHVAGAALGQIVDFSCYAFLDYDEYETVPFDIPRSGDYITSALQILDYFWDCVQADKPPVDIAMPPLGTLPVVSGEIIQLVQADLVEFAAKMTEMYLASKEYEAEYAKFKLEAKETLGYGKFQAHQIGKINVLPRSGRATLDAKGLLNFCRALCVEKGIEFDEALFTRVGANYDEVRVYPAKEMKG